MQMWLSQLLQLLNYTEITMLEFGRLYFVSKLQELLSNVFFARPQWLSRPSNATKYAPLLLTLGRSSALS